MTEQIFPCSRSKSITLRASIKKITMRSILKKIAERKNYKENISIEPGVDPRNYRTAAELLTTPAIIYYGYLA